MKLLYPNQGKGRFKHRKLHKVLILSPLPTSRLVIYIVRQKTGDHHFKGNMRYVQPQGRIAGRNRAFHFKFNAVKG
jgi:hypothetical protein